MPMKKSLDILTIGDLCADVVLSGKDVTPEFGQKEKLVEDYIVEMGGSGSIFICQAAKLGLSSALIGRVGDDPFGRMIKKTIEESGASSKFIRTDPHEKTGATFMLNKGHDRAMMTYSGTIDAVVPSDIPVAALKSTRHFHLASFFLMKKIQPHLLRFVRIAKQAGASISMDTNWDPDENWDRGIRKILPYVDVFLPNEAELLNIADEKKIADAVAKMQKLVKVVVVKKGPKGADAYAHGKKFSSPALKVKVADTVGAGDSFDAGFLFGFLKGKSISECLRIGCICGSLNTTMPGGTKGQPGLLELKKYLRQI
jgi:sugar/nucleoside kinase (ribokinase family)